MHHVSKQGNSVRERILRSQSRVISRTKCVLFFLPLFMPDLAIRYSRYRSFSRIARIHKLIHNASWYYSARWRERERKGDATFDGSLTRLGAPWVKNAMEKAAAGRIARQCARMHASLIADRRREKGSEKERGAYCSVRALAGLGHGPSISLNMRAAESGAARSFLFSFPPRSPPSARRPLLVAPSVFFRPFLPLSLPPAAFQHLFSLAGDSSLPSPPYPLSSPRPFRSFVSSLPSSSLLSPRVSFALTDLYGSTWVAEVSPAAFATLYFY